MSSHPILEKLQHARATWTSATFSAGECAHILAVIDALGQAAKIEDKNDVEIKRVAQRILPEKKT